MDVDDDDFKKKSEPLQAVLKEDLYDYSVDELEDRVADLKAEITRTENEIKAKGSSMSAAEAAFK
jgi:uncharacterized small protein (DUF1192 family)